MPVSRIILFRVRRPLPTPAASSAVCLFRLSQLERQQEQRLPCRKSASEFSPVWVIAPPIPAHLPPPGISVLEITGCRQRFSQHKTLPRMPSSCWSLPRMRPKKRWADRENAIFFAVGLTRCKSHSDCGILGVCLPPGVSQRHPVIPANPCSSLHPPTMAIPSGDS